MQRQQRLAPHMAEAAWQELIRTNLREHGRQGGHCGQDEARQQDDNPNLTFVSGSNQCFSPCSLATSAYQQIRIDMLGL